MKVANESVASYDGKTKRKLARLCNELVKEEKGVKPERLDLNPLDVTPSFQLNVTLTHHEGEHEKQ